MITVGGEMCSDIAVLFFGDCLHDNGAGAVAEQHTSGTIVPVHDR